MGVNWDQLGPAVGGDSSRADFVYSTLRAAICEARLRPGDRLRETEVAGRLGVSRTPVREALKRLESEGLLAFAPGRGLIVAELDQQQVLELYSLREVLEGAAASLAAQHASEVETRALRDLVARQAEVPPEDLAAQIQVNQHFHQMIYRAARNRYLLEALNSLRDSLALLRDTTYAAPDRPAAALQEHQRIADAIERRDVAAAESAARHHIRTAGQVRLSMLFEADR